MEDQEERTRHLAYQIWLEEGRPKGRAAIHWEMAKERVAIEDGRKASAKPAHRHSNGPTLAADTVEPAAPPANAGKLPTTVGDGEQIHAPKRQAGKQAAAQQTSAGKTTASAKTTAPAKVAAPAKGAAKPPSATGSPPRPRTKK